jgi:hypothetical protein
MFKTLIFVFLVFIALINIIVLSIATKHNKQKSYTIDIDQTITSLDKYGMSDYDLNLLKKTLEKLKEEDRLDEIFKEDGLINLDLLYQEYHIDFSIDYNKKYPSPPAFPHVELPYIELPEPFEIKMTERTKVSGGIGTSEKLSDYVSFPKDESQHK